MAAPDQTGSPLTPVLQSLFDYFLPLATQAHDWDGIPALCTPETNILALNAVYLADRAKLPQLWRSGRPVQTPLVVLSDSAIPGQDVGGLRVGLCRPPDLKAPSGAVVVEQISRLQLSSWSNVLAAAYDTPEWGGMIARYLAEKLDGDRNSVLLMAYRKSEAIGVLLWRETKEGAAAHLWGSLDPSADLPLLRAAYDLTGTPLSVSLPDHCSLSLPEGQVVTFTRPRRPLEPYQQQKESRGEFQTVSPANNTQGPTQTPES